MDKNDLISRRELIERIEQYREELIDSGTLSTDFALEVAEVIIDKFINTAPAVDPEELKPRGKNVTDMNPVDEFICSECGFKARDIQRYDAEDDVYIEFEVEYCPHCGAYMRRDNSGKE